MTRAKSKRAKSKLAKSSVVAHPAITALHEAHAALRAAFPTVGACFDSDLKHDERAIAANAEQAFVWLVSPWGTHMARLGTAADCYADTRRSWSNVTAAMLISAACDGCYDAEAIPRGWLRLYVWDGRALTRYPTVTALCGATAAVIRRHASEHVARQRAPLQEVLAYLRGSATAAEYQARLDEIDRSIADVETWGPA